MIRGRLEKPGRFMRPGRERTLPESKDGKRLSVSGAESACQSRGCNRRLCMAEGLKIFEGAYFSFARGLDFPPENLGHHDELCYDEFSQGV